MFSADSQTLVLLYSNSLTVSCRVIEPVTCMLPHILENGFIEGTVPNVCNCSSY